METLVTALGPVFAAGLAIQQLLELLDSVLLKKLIPEDYKKAILGALSLVGGLALAFGAGLRVLELLGVTSPWYWEELTTGLIISGALRVSTRFSNSWATPKRERRPTPWRS